MAVVALAVLVWLSRGHQVTVSAPPIGGDYERYQGRIFTVVKVVDGDTFDIAAPDRDRPTTRIRLWGVDTPEVAGSPRGAMHYGAEASAFAKTTLNGQRVRLELVEDDTRGKFGRLLAYVYVEGTGVMLNEALLEGGYAYADPRFPHPRLASFLQLESQARAANVGLWSSVTPDQMPGWRQRRN